MCYINIWFCPTQLLWWYAVIAIPSVVLLVTQEVGHMFHLLPITHFPMLLGLRETVCAILLWCKFSCITCSCFQHGSCTVALEQMYLCSPLLSCPCTLMNTSIHEQGISSPAGQRSCILACGNVLLTTKLKFCIVLYIYIYLRKPFSVVYIEAYSSPHEI